MSQTLLKEEIIWKSRSRVVKQGYLIEQTGLGTEWLRFSWYCAVTLIISRVSGICLSVLVEWKQQVYMRWSTNSYY